jgi:hypothetical protein
MQQKVKTIHRVESISTDSIENQLEGIFRAHVNMCTEIATLRKCLNSIMSKILIEKEVEVKDERST